jgi:transmembrane sensor
VTHGDRRSRRREERLRLEAAAWFARLRAPDGEASQASFEAWRGDDPRRARAYDRLVRRWEEAAVFARSGSPATARPLPRRPARPWVLATGYGLAAVSAIAVLVAVGIATAPPFVVNRLAALGWPQRIRTPISQIRKVRLADGSQIVLDTDTVLSARLTSGARHVDLLQGRARFDVTADPSRPFVVEAGGGELSTPGGEFDVSLSADRLVAVSLFRGVVDVGGAARRGRAGAARRLRLVSGQGLAFRPATAAPLAPYAAAAPAAWPSGFLDFHRTPLSAAVAEANRYSQKKIILADPALGPLAVSGMFKATETADLAACLAAMFALRLERTPAGDFRLRPAAPA